MALRRAQCAALGLAWMVLADPLRAQVCSGFASLRERHFRVAVGVASYTSATAIEGSFTAGKAVYATVGSGTTRNGTLDASTFDLRGEVGADVALGPAHRVFVCPAASYSLSHGPDDFLLTGENYRYTGPSVGLGLAAVAVRTRRLEVLVAGGWRTTRLTTARSGWPTVTDDYELWTLEAGLVLDGRITVRPSLSIPKGFVPAGRRDDYAVPFGREDGEISLGISIGISLGGKPAKSSPAQGGPGGPTSSAYGLGPWFPQVPHSR